METGSAQGAGRTRLGTPWPYRVLNIVFALFFLAVVVLAIVANQNAQAGFTWYWLLLAAAGGVGVAFLLSRLFAVLPPPSKTVEIIIVLVLFAAYATVQVRAGWGLRVQPDDTSAFGQIHTAAVAYAQNGTLPGDYFAHFPGDAGVYFLLANYYAILTLFGVTDLAVGAFVLNIVAIDGALVLLYFCGRRLFGARQALFLLVCAFLTLPFLLYTPLWGADTLALVFPIAAVLLWMQTRALWRKGETGRAIGRFCILSLVCGVGAVVKVTVAIVWLAIVIDLLVLLGGQGRWKLLLAGLAVMAVALGGGRFGVQHSAVLPQYGPQDTVPVTHWMMMGLDGTGAYNEADFEQILAVEGDARTIHIANEIGGRLQEKGFPGVLQQLGRKLSATFGDGTYGAGEQLAANAAQPGNLHEWFAAGGRNYTLLSCLAFAVEMAMLVWMAVAALMALVRRNHALTFMRVALFGLLLFLALWETQPRYLISFLPLALLCAVEAAPLPGAGKEARRQARRARIQAMRPPVAVPLPPPQDDLDAVPLGTETFPAITPGQLTSTHRFDLQQDPPAQATLFEEPATPLQQTQPIWAAPLEAEQPAPAPPDGPEALFGAQAETEWPAPLSRQAADGSPATEDAMTGELWPEADAPQAAEAWLPAEEPAAQQQLAGSEQGGVLSTQ